MRKVTIVESDVEPNKEHLWLYNGDIKYYSNNGWVILDSSNENIKEALSAANEAKSAASTASKNATQAQELATEAKTVAEQAQGTATAASAAAENEATARIEADAALKTEIENNTTEISELSLKVGELENMIITTLNTAI